jgi:hypothetical protein
MKECNGKSRILAQGYLRQLYNKQDGKIKIKINNISSCSSPEAKFLV